MDSAPKGILTAHPAGGGKTMIAAMAIARSASSSERFSTVVTTNTLVDQWKSEFAEYFEPVANNTWHSLRMLTWYNRAL